MFHNANLDALIVMAQRMRPARFEPGTTLCQIDAQSGFLYNIQSGRVRCTTKDGTQFTCGPGYPLGHLDSQCNAPRWYGAVADTSVTVFRIEIDVFADTLEQHPEMAIDFVSGLASALITRRAEMREAVSTVVAQTSKHKEEFRNESSLEWGRGRR